ncbi:hypothetical protein B0H11DRAFT_1935573 [Mycena galericulata]|nr:hypothetical protein B0H11DRAFT_1935573 [Mycena galericulata]
MSAENESERHPAAHAALSTRISWPRCMRGWMRVPERDLRAPQQRPHLVTHTGARIATTDEQSPRQQHFIGVDPHARGGVRGFTAMLRVRLNAGALRIDHEAPDTNTERRDAAAWHARFMLLAVQVIPPMHGCTDAERDKNLCHLWSGTASKNGTCETLDRVPHPKELFTNTAIHTAHPREGARITGVYVHLNRYVAFGVLAVVEEGEKPSSTIDVAWKKQDVTHGTPVTHH